MKKLVRFLMGSFLGLTFLMAPALAAPLFNVPTTVAQPDGTVLELYSSGDEFFNYIHDAEGRLIMRNDEGWYVYAQEEDGAPAATGMAVGAAPEDDGPALFSAPRGMTVRDIDFEAHPELRHEYPMPEDAEPTSVDEETEGQLGSRPISKVAPKMANLVIFIRFQGEEEFVTGSMEAQDPKAAVPADVQSQSGLTELDFGNSYTQVSTYMDKVSNGLFDIDTTFLTADKEGKVICSYEDIYPRSYYEPYSASNPNGVYGNGDDRFYREMYLLERALMATGESLGYAGWPELDYDGDGKIDNITFVVSGSTAGWSDLLWPHSWALQLDKVSFHSGAENGPFKLAYQFNFNFANPRYAGIGVLSHELLHSVGYPDLYRYDYSGDPVGAWDAMGTTDYADPQFLGAYLKDAYAGWGRIGEITGSGTYTLYPIGTEEDADGLPPLEGYRIPTDVMGEYIYVEYRKSGTYGDVTQDNVPRDGLLVYRANRKTVAGNRNGTVNGGDEVYIFRPGDSAPNAGTAKELNKAALSDAYGYTSIGGEKNSGLEAEETLYYDSGENSGIVVDQVTRNSDGTISFRVTLPSAPTALAPGRYDVGDKTLEGENWYIDQPGEYTFYGSSTDRQIIVAVNTPDVHLTLEGLKMDLSAASGQSPIALRGGSEVEISVEGQVTLQGGEYASGILVEEGAQAVITGPGTLVAAGGAGAPGVGGSAFTPGGRITLRELTAQFSGGDPFTLYSGSTILMVSYGSSALGGGSQQTCQGITIENCDLTVRGGGSVHSIATSYSYGSTDYAAGGDIVIRNSRISAFGGVLAGPNLTAENSTLAVWADNDIYYGSALAATKKLKLINCQTRLEASGVFSAVNRPAMNCEVEVLGGSLWGFAWSSGILGPRIAISADTQVMLASTSALDLLRGADEELEDGGVVLLPASDGTQAILFQGIFTDFLGSGGLMALTDGGSNRSYVELPKKTKTFVLSLPAQGSYTLIDQREAQCDGINAAGVFNRGNGLSFREQPVGKTPIDLSKGSYTITQNGSYILSGSYEGAELTVAPNITATIYLNGVDLTGPVGKSALSLGDNATVRVIAYNRSENTLRGVLAPALSAPSNSTMTLTGTGSVLAIGKGAGAVSAGSFTVDQSVGFTALSDQSSALVRRAGSWKSPDGVEPVIVYGQLSQPLNKDVILTFAGTQTSARAEAPAGTVSFLHNLGRQDSFRLRTSDGSTSQEVVCRQMETDAGVLTLTGEDWVSMTLDLSKDSYTITQNGTYTVIGSTNHNYIQVAPNVSATLVLENVSVNQRVEDGMMVQVPDGIIALGSNTDVTVEVPQGTRSSLKVERSDKYYVSAIYVPASARLTLRGEGELHLQGGPYGVALGAAERVSAGEIIVEGTKLTLDCYGGSGVVLGGASAKVTISGGTITSTYRYGTTIGGSGSTVLVTGGSLNLRGRQLEAALGGAGANITITGGDINFQVPVGTCGIGGQSAQVHIRGGRIVADGGSEGEAMACKYILGGQDARITMTGGSLEGEVYRRYGDYTGALGGQGATAAFGGEAQVFLRLLGETAPALCNADLLQEQEGSFLEVRFAHELTGSDTITLTPKSGGAPRQIVLPQGAWGFFTLLPQGVYDLTNSSGGYGGAASLTQAGITKLEDVSFDRLKGVYFESKTFPYDGQTHTLTLNGFTSGMGSVVYSDNSKREPGTYTAKAIITPTGGAPYTLTATLTITRGTLTVTGVKANDKAVYDGTTATTGQVLYTGAVGGDVPGFKSRFAFTDPDVGRNKTVNVTNIVLDALWAGRYDLVYANGMGTSAVTTASILSPATAAITIDGGSLYQLAGNVQPLVYKVKPESLACTVAYNGSATVPQGVGEYTVTVTVDNSQNPNYTGSATATMVVAQGFDLSQGSLTISQPGNYLVTGSTTSNTITVNKCSGTVRLYLSGVDVRLTAAGASPLEVADSAYDVEIYPLPGTENLLWGGPNAPAINISGLTSVLFKGAGELSVLAGSGSSQAIRTSYRVNGSTLPLVGSTLSWVRGDLVKDFGLPTGKWVVYSFAAAPTQDVPLIFQQEGYGRREVTLPAGCRSLLIPGFYMWNGVRTQLIDEAGHVLAYGVCPEYGDLYLYDVPYAYAEPVVQDIDISDSSLWPHRITKNGTYRVIGDNSASMPIDRTGKFQEWVPMLEVSDNVLAELIFDNITVGRCAMGPLVKLGTGCRVTVGLMGKNILTNCWDSIFAEPFSAGNNCTSHLILKDGAANGRAAAGSAQLTFGYYKDYDSEGKTGGDKYGVGAAIHVGTLDVEGGDWSIIAMKNRTAAWGIRTYGDVSMTGGRLTIQGEIENQNASGTVVGNPAQDNTVRGLGGLWAQGNIRLTGNSELNIYNKSGTYANTPHYYAAVYCGNSSNSKSEWGLSLDGEAVKMTVDTTGAAAAIRTNTLKLLRGELDLSVRFRDNTGLNKISALTLGPDFVLNGCAAFVEERGSDEAYNGNVLLSCGSGFTLSGVDGSQPVLVDLDLLSPIRPNSKTSGFTLQVTSPDDPDFSRTIEFPTLYDTSIILDEYWKYQSFLLSLPGPGEYQFTYFDRTGNQLTKTLALGEGYTEVPNVTFATAAAIHGLDLPDDTFTWDGKPKSLTLTGTLPDRATVSYSGNDQTEPGIHVVTVTVQAPGYRDWNKSAKLTIKKASLSVEAIQADDKEMYDGTTLTTGTVILSGAIPGDDITATAAFHFNTPDVGQNKTVTATDLQIQGWEGHYELALPDAPLTTTASILHKAPVTITWTEPTLTQTYGTVSAVGAAAVDPLTVGKTDENGTPKEAVKLKVRVDYSTGALPTLPGSYPVTAVVEDNNYEGSAQNTLLIQPRPITITGLQVPSIRQGDSLSLTVTLDKALAQLFGVLSQDLEDVSISYTAVYPDDTPGKKTVAIEELTLTGDKAGRYRLEAATGMGTVLAADAPILSSITVTAPTKTTYKKGETLDKAGMKVTAVFSDGTTEDVTADALCAPTQLPETGTVTIVVSYQGKTAVFTVTVTNDSGSGEGGGNGGSGGGGGGGGGSSSKPSKPSTTEAKPAETQTPAKPPETAGFKIVNSDPLPFVDLSETHWAISDITWCYQRGLVQGLSADIYGPEVFMNRAMFVTVLGRMEKVDTAKYSGSTFDDVEVGSWYAPYVAWGQEVGVVKGRSETEFDPFASITREETALIIDRYLKLRSVKVTAGKDTVASFTDRAKISSWAWESVESIRKTGLMQGYPDGAFGPQNRLFRSEATALLHRLCLLRYPNQ